MSWDGWDNTDPTLQRVADGLRGHRMQSPERVQRPERPNQAPALPPPPSGAVPGETRQRIRRPGASLPPEELVGHRRPANWSSATSSGMPTDPPPFTSASRTKSGRHWNTGEQAKVPAVAVEGGASGRPLAPSRLWQARQVLACVREILVILLLVALVASLARSGWGVLPSVSVS